MRTPLPLLLALAAALCAFTRASPTPLPTAVDTGLEAFTLPAGTHVTLDTEAEADTTKTQEELPVITSATEAPSEPAAAPAEVTSHAAERSAVTAEAPATDAPETDAPAAGSPATDAPDTAAPDTAAPATDAPATKMETQAHEASEATEEPVVETDAPHHSPSGASTPIAEVEEASRSEAEDGVEVVVEGGEEEGLSSGQVAGIVIGALVAVIVVIAVVIAAVRRMGKYSSAKNKKPAKKDGGLVSPLRRKPVKQEERPKFWKF